VLSITAHITNQHTFAGNMKHKRCEHGDLPENRNKAWLKPGSFAVKKLEAAIRGKNNCRLNDLQYMLGFTHTGLTLCDSDELSSSFAKVSYETNN
jgi:hypothetical protein